MLGDTTVTNMIAIPTSTFANSDVRLRVWFNDGTHGFQLLTPDQRIAPNGYLPDNSVTTSKIAAGAVGNTQTGFCIISGVVSCNVTDSAHTFVYARGTSALSYVGNVSGGTYPYQLMVPQAGTYTVVVHASDGSETSTSVTVTAGQTLSNVNLSPKNLLTDSSNCGSCGYVCSGNNGSPSCASGSCSIVCNPGYANCDNNASNGCEVNITTDVNNCGSCGHTCSGGANVAVSGCASGTCTITSCNTGYADCDGNAANGCETNTGTSVNNCGSCGFVCNLSNATAACTGGQCAVAACNAGYANCDNNAADGCEVNIGTDPTNCGGCGKVCSIPNGVPLCSAGACAIAACNPGYANCDNNVANGCETNTNTSLTNCGSCGLVCTVANGVPLCSAGACAVASCNAGYANCDNNAANGCEVNTTNDRNNCGSCGLVCAAGKNCVASVCK